MLCHTQLMYMISKEKLFIKTANLKYKIVLKKLKLRKVMLENNIFRFFHYQQKI